MCKVYLLADFAHNNKTELEFTMWIRTACKEMVQINLSSLYLCISCLPKKGLKPKPKAQKRVLS